jgi:hypothetical protein
VTKSGLCMGVVYVSNSPSRYRHENVLQSLALAVNESNVNRDQIPASRRVLGSDEPLRFYESAIPSAHRPHPIHSRQANERLVLYSNIGIGTYQDHRSMHRGNMGNRGGSRRILCEERKLGNLVRYNADGRQKSGQGVTPGR